MTSFDQSKRQPQLESVRFEKLEDSCIKYNFEHLKLLLQPRPQETHKGNNGHVLVVGGDLGFAGATMMAAEAALRSGTGLVSIATRKEHISCVTSYRPEIMCHGIEDAKTLENLIKKATTIIVGPGLGQSLWSHMMFNISLEANIPTVLDADGLNILAKSECRLSEHCVLTPHAGEAAKLIGCSVEDIQNNRIRAIHNLRNKYAKCIVLKGSGTLILDQNQETPVLCAYGNPGMSSGGTGDVLSGVIGGLLAQGFNTNTAAVLGVYIHSIAADIASQQGERGMIATDLMPNIRRLVNQM